MSRPTFDRHGADSRVHLAIGLDPENLDGILSCAYQLDGLHLIGALARLTECFTVGDKVTESPNLWLHWAYIDSHQVGGWAVAGVRTSLVGARS